MDRPNFIERRLAELSAEGKKLSGIEGDFKKTLEYVLQEETDSSSGSLKRAVADLNARLTAMQEVLKEAQDEVEEKEAEIDMLQETIDDMQHRLHTIEGVADVDDEESDPEPEIPTTPGPTKKGKKKKTK